MQTFEGIYSFYCDCVKVVQLVDFPQPPSSWDDVVVNESIPLGSGGAVASASADHGHLVNSPAQRTNAHTNSRMFAYVLSRGVEALDAEDNTVSKLRRSGRI